MPKFRYEKQPASVVKKNRTFYKNHVKRLFIAFCAYEGYFDDIFTKQEIKKAKKGYLPEDCDVHHKIPLSGTNDLFVNDFTNLVVLHKETHKKLNKYVLAPQIRPTYKAEAGTTIYVEAPAYDFVDIEGIKTERALQHLLKEKKFGRRR